MAIAYHSFEEAKRSLNTDITINKPAGVVEDDLMVAVIAVSSLETPTSAGWTNIQSGGNSALSLAVLYKKAGGSEPDNYTFSWSNQRGAYGFIMRFSGQDTSTPINVSGITSGTSANPVCPSVTTDKDDCLILRIFGADHHSITVDSGYPDGTTGITVDKNLDDFPQTQKWL